MDTTEIYCVIKWVNNNPIIDGAKCFLQMKDAVEYAEQEESKHNLIKHMLEDIDVKFTLPRIYLVK